MTYKQALKKRAIKTALVRPIVFAGWLLSAFFRPGSKHRLFLFASSADVDNANLNNADLARLFVDLNPIVIFSNKPRNDQSRHLFDIPGVIVWDLHKRIGYKFFPFVNIFYRGVISRWINHTSDAIVLGGESLYFYKVVPWLRPRTKTVEFTHLNTWFDYTQQFVKDMDVRVFSTNYLMENVKAFYEKQQIDSGLADRMRFIDNMVSIPDSPVFNRNDQLEVVFIGRGSYEKRVNLVADIAKAAHQRRIPVHFSFVGNVEQTINPKSLPFCTFYGGVENRDKLTEIQKRSDVLILPSGFEGLPMTVMEMMAFGKAIVAIAAKSTPEYIKDGVNGYLLPGDSEDKKIAEDVMIALSILAHDRDTLREMGQKNFSDARIKFSKELFEKKWRQILK